MKNWSKYIYILAIILLGACTDEEGNTPDPGISDDVTIQIEFPTESQGIKSKALDENGIDSLEILVFTPPTPGATLSTADLFAYRITKRGTEIQYVADNKRKVTAKLKRNKEQRIVLLGNISGSTKVWLDNSLQEGITTLADILPNLIYSGAPWGVDRSTGGETSFPMWGQENAFQTIASTGTPTAKTIKMVRAVSKISVEVDETDPTIGFGTLFTLDEIHVCNSVPNGYIAPNADQLHLEQVTKPNQGTGTRTDISYGPTEKIYIPECDTLIGANTPTFLVIKARYREDGVLNPYYYRIDFTYEGKSVQLLRNHSYNILIKNVRSRGYLTLAEAKNALGSNLGFSITIGESTTNPQAETQIDYITYSDQYMLGTSASDVKLDWMAYQGSNSYKLPVLTNYTGGGWNAELVSGANWLSLGNTTGAAGQVNYLNLVVATPNLTLASRTAEIKLTAGTLTLPVKITQIIGSNSYVVTPGGSVQIPVNSANLAGDRVSGATDLRLKVLWQNGTTVSVPSTALDGDDIFTVTAGAVPGNALISLVKEGGGPTMVGGLPGDETVWSWHIWVTTPAPETDLKPNNRYIFMNRNLGANNVSGTGLYYQWGRKDPFTGSVNASSVFEVVAANNLGNAIKNPTIFYKVLSSPFDWIGSTQNNSLWNTIANEKSPYDPCPYGWRVPICDNISDSPWDGFTSNTRNGITFPLAGGLTMGTGQLSGSGTQGNVWTGSVVGAQARVFRFTATTGTHNVAYRAQAYPVRCVKDVKR